MASTDPDFPFCSDRCRLIDLGKWASGGYVISSPVNDADESIRESNPEDSEDRVVTDAAPDHKTDVLATVAAEASRSRSALGHLDCHFLGNRSTAPGSRDLGISCYCIALGSGGSAN